MVSFMYLNRFIATLEMTTLWTTAARDNDEITLNPYLGIRSKRKGFTRNELFAMI